MSISKLLDLKWQSSLLSFFEITETVSGSFINVINLECLLKGIKFSFRIYYLLKIYTDQITFPMIYFQAILSSLLPFLLIIFIYFCWILLFIIKRKIETNYKEKLLSTFIIIIFWLQPIILKSLFNIISCRLIDKSYIQSDLTVECFTKEHIEWIYKLFIPSFCFYGIILPIAALIYMRAYSNELHLGKHMHIVGFLTNGYRSRKFYWEFIFFYRKFVIIFIAQFFLWKIESKTLLVLMILFISLWQQTRDNPFITDDLNSLDFKATIFSFYTLFLGLFSYEFSEFPIGIIIVILIFVFNIAFIIIWVRRILMLNTKIFYRPRVRKFFTWMFPYLERIQEEYNYIEREASNSVAVIKSKKSKFESGEKRQSIFRSLRMGMSGSLQKNQTVPPRNNSDNFSKFRKENTELGEFSIAKNEEICENNREKAMKLENIGIDISQEEHSDQSASRLNKDNVIEAELNNQSSFKYLSKNEKKTFEDSDEFLNLLSLKDYQISSLYAEIRELKQEIQEQKVELESLRKKLKNASPSNFKEIQSIELIKQDYFRTSEIESGFFLEKIEIDESSLFQSFTTKSELEISTSHFNLSISPPKNNKRILATDFSIDFKGLKEKTFVHSVRLKPSKNVFVSPKKFGGFLGEKNISFALEKINRLDLELKYYLIVEMILANENKEYKIEIKIPIENWFLFLNVQKFEESKFNDGNEILLAKQVDGQFFNDFVRESGFIESFLRRSFLAMIGVNVEGENINLILEYQKDGLFKVISESLKQKFVIFIKKWIEEEFFTKFLGRLILN